MTNLQIPPPIAVFLAKHPMVDNYDLTSVRLIMAAAAPLSADTEREVCNRLKGKDGKDIKVVQSKYTIEYRVTIALHCTVYTESVFFNYFIYRYIYKAYFRYIQVIVNCSNGRYKVWDGKIRIHTGQPSSEES